jgi:hypothetical protein
VGPRAGLDTEARGKILCPCRGSNPDLPVVQPVVRQYRLVLELTRLLYIYYKSHMNVDKCLDLRPIVNQKTSLSGTWHRTHLETYGPVFISCYFKRAFQLVDIDLRVGMPRGIVGRYQLLGEYPASLFAVVLLHSRQTLAFSPPRELYGCDNVLKWYMEPVKEITDFIRKIISPEKWQRKTC